jgi:hypothetical protein
MAIFSVTTLAAASGTKHLTARAEGQLVFQAPCEDAPAETPLTCQTAVVTGQVTHIGRITGVLLERVDAVGSYTGSATFTTPNGDTFTTAYTGQAFPPDPSGTVSFVEWHKLVRGTGRFDEAQGTLYVEGSASATGAITIAGTGTLDR